MSEQKSKKKKQPKEETVQRTDYQRVGDVLRQAREEKGLSVEKAAAAIHIRAAQVRAIEDGNLEALPGITYATGFIRSYAAYLKLDSTEIVNRFKAENTGAATARPELNFPEPLAEDKMPSILMIGLGAFCALVLLVGWVVFSGGENEKVAEIPAAPAVATTAPVTTFLSVGDSAAAGAAAAAADASVTAAAVPLTTDLAAATAPGAPVEDVSAQINNNAAAPAVPAAAVPVTSETAVALAPAAAPAVAATEVPSLVPAPAAPADEEIKIAPPKSRIALRATGTSWVQVVDSSRRVIYKKVLLKGDQYAVPDMPGLTLMASNAGGIDVYVDGKRTAALGSVGEIVRGLPLDPGALKKRRARIRDY